MILDGNFRIASGTKPVPSNLDQPIPNLNKSVVLITMDTEGIHEIWKPGKAKHSSYGSTDLELSKVADIAPGPAFNKWHQCFDACEFVRHEYRDRHSEHYEDFGGMSHITQRV